ncbi:MAG: hypothetical protein IKK93_00830 [Campylobacter sp.]|nr:hypothetical protein [Campylobacter sp.]
MTKKEIEEKAVESCTRNLCPGCCAEEDCDEKCEEFEGMVNGYILACTEHNIG